MNAIQQIIGWMPALLQATGVTLALSVTSVLTALVLAVFLALGKISKNTVLRSVCGAYIFFFRGTPLLMQLFFLYYTLPQLVPAFNIQSRFLAAWIAFSLNVAAYLAEIIRAVFQWQALGPITNGANMITQIPTFSSFNIKTESGTIYLSSAFPMLIMILCLAVIVMLINSSYGRAFKAIREDEIAAEAMGINLPHHKMLSFCISSFFAGVGGALFAMYASNAQAMVYTSTMTYEILLIVVIGGIGSISGSVIATFLYVACSEWWLRGLDSGSFLGIQSDLFRNGFRMVVFSVVIMIVVLFFRRGIMGDREITDLFKKRPRKAAKEAVK